ncbi:hypothetical protein ACHAXR_007504 [Thalassiosira sp. AJA248-18]
MMIAKLFLVVVAIVPSAFAFVPSTKGAALSLVKGAPSPKIILPKQNKNIIEHDGDGIIDECTTAATGSHAADGESTITATRRNALLRCCSSMALLTTASSCSLPYAMASDDDEDTITTTTAAQQPFTVLFTIQLDSNKPDELSDLEIECRPDWAPLASARFKELVELGFYKDCPFFRVLPGFIAQFGVSSDPNLNKEWMYCDTTADEETVKLCKPPLMDERRLQSNKKGTLSFATSGKNTRRTQVFVNLGDNSGVPNFLDGQNFVPFARIVRGEDVIKQLNREYGGKVNQGKAAYYGGEYFEKVFPRLSIIRDARVM